LDPPALLEHDPEKWIPVSRLREALAQFIILGSRFGGRSKVGKDHAPARSHESDRPSQRINSPFTIRW
jgi:hypothetical protein